MNYYVLTLFRDMIDQYMNTSMMGRAAAAGLIQVSTIDIRDFAENKHKRVDDYPYGGGAGMVMAAGPVYRACEYAKALAKTKTRIIYLTPQGQVFSQEKAKELAGEENLIFLCGHYEGIDERALELEVTDYLSIGDYILTGGELPAMVMMDAITRLIPEALGNEDSAEFESLRDHLLEYPQYTRPEHFMGLSVPEVLLSGHHAKIGEWRRQQSLTRTLERREDLFSKVVLTKKDKKFMEEQSINMEKIKMADVLAEKFYQVFGREGGFASAYFSPGRVNLIGEHTDYNGGHVFPCALTIGTYGVARKSEDHKLRFYSMQFEELGMFESTLDDLTYKKEFGWTNYPKAVIWALQQKGFQIGQGFDLLISGTIPNSSGLSSSASIEVLTAFIMMDLFGLSLPMLEAAKIAQFAENEYIGVKCGILDQFAVAMGRKDCAIFLDTSDLSYEYAQVPMYGVKIVIMNTNKKRALSDSKYNERRSECEQALRELKTKLAAESLGELTEEQFEANKAAITNPVCRKRAKHAVSENQRTIKAVKALKKNDLSRFGGLMMDSHTSLRDDYEVTGIELDTIVLEAQKHPACFGARMTGAGFGGCAVSLVKEKQVDDFIASVGQAYRDKIGFAADFYVVGIGDGPIKLT